MLDIYNVIYLWKPTTTFVEKFLKKTSTNYSFYSTFKTEIACQRLVKKQKIIFSKEEIVEIKVIVA